MQSFPHFQVLFPTINSQDQGQEAYDLGREGGEYASRCVIRGLCGDCWDVGRVGRVTVVWALIWWCVDDKS